MTSDDTSTDPVLTLAMMLRIECTPFEAVGATGKGIRRISNLLSGTFEIPAQNAGNCFMERRLPSLMRATTCALKTGT